MTTDVFLTFIKYLFAKNILPPPLKLSILKYLFISERSNQTIFDFPIKSREFILIAHAIKNHVKFPPCHKMKMFIQ